jgi:flagellar hook-length control protein FliK
MLIDSVPGPANVAPTRERTAASSGAPVTGRGSFEALLDAASDVPTDSEVSDQDDDEEGAVDEWMTVPVLVPSVPVIPPPDVITCEEVRATGAAAAGDEQAASADAIVAASDTAIPAAVTPSVSQDVAPPAGAQAEQPHASIAIGEEIPEPPELEPRRSQRPRPIHVDVFETTTDANTGVAGPVAEEPAPKAPEAGTAKGGNPVSTPKTLAGTDVATSTAAQEMVKAVAAQQPETGSSGLPEQPTKSGIAIGEPGSRGTATRLARAISRIEEAPMLRGAPATTGENTPSFTQSGDGQQSFGEWFREQLPQAVANGHTPALPPTFSVVAPFHDSRVGETLAISGGPIAPNASMAPGEHDLTLQLVQSLRMQFRDGIGEAVLKLKPEHLGSVSITLKVENGGLKANVQAEMPAVRQWLESQQDTLRSALADQGLRLDQFDVEPDSRRQAPSDDAEPESRQRRRQARRSPATDSPVFEVVV